MSCFCVSSSKHFQQALTVSLLDTGQTPTVSPAVLFLWDVAENIRTDTVNMQIKSNTITSENKRPVGHHNPRHALTGCILP